MTRMDNSEALRKAQSYALKRKFYAGRSSTLKKLSKLLRLIFTANAQGKVKAS